MFWHRSILTTLAFASSISSYELTEECPLPGAVFSRNFNIKNSQALKKALETIPSSIEALFETGLVNKSLTAVALDVFSTSTNESLYSYFYNPPIYKDTPTKGSIDENTIFRVGSVSKIFTVYAILAKAGSLAIFEEPVTKYVPQLKGDPSYTGLDKIKWDDITIGALASQQGGAGGAFLDATLCFINNNATDCPLEEYYAQLLQKRPQQAIGHEGLYADNGFVVLGRALEGMANMKYSEALNEILVRPLNLTSTSVYEPKGAYNGWALNGTASESSWGQDNQLTAPSGGVYSSAADLRKLAASIMQYSLLSPAVTRSWMKPKALHPSLAEALGAPWEIQRTPITVSPDGNRTRIIDLYTKVGGNAGYGSIFAISPDHNLGFSVNVGGATSVERFYIRDVVAEVFMTAGEHAAFENAKANFTGTYVLAGHESTNATITVNPDRPGYRLEKLFINGTDSRALVSPGLGDLTAAQLAKVAVTLYPVGLENSTYMSTRATLEFLPSTVPRAMADGGTSVFNGIACDSAYNVGFVPDVDEFVFEIKDGKAVAMSSIGYSGRFNVTEYPNRGAYRMERMG